MTPAPEVTVIVPARNAGDGLSRLAAALRAQTLAPQRWEAIFVDDASTDGSADAAEAAGVFSVIRRATCGGSYAARNDGLAVARGDVIAFVDVDCMPAPEWLERGLARLRAGDATLVAGHVEVPVGRTPTTAALVDRVSFLDQESMVRKGVAVTANLWVSRDVFDRVGPFNDRVSSGGDQEFTERAVRHGERLVYGPEVVVVHPPRTRPSELARKGYRIGFADAEHRRHAESSLARRDRPCAQPGNWLPRRRIWSFQRLQGTGIALHRRRRARMYAAQYLFLQLPMLWGNVVGSVRVR